MSPDNPLSQLARHIRALNFSLVYFPANQPAMCAAAGTVVGVASPCGKLEKFSILAEPGRELVQLERPVGTERDQSITWESLTLMLMDALSAN